MGIEQFYRRVDTLVDLDPDARQALAELPVAVSTKKRWNLIVPALEEQDAILVVLAGWIARYSVRADGSRRITGFMLPGDFCGIHAICGALTDHAVGALSECELGRIDRGAMDRLATRFPVFDQALWRAKLTEEATLRKWLVNSTDAYASLAHLLCELVERNRIAGLLGDDVSLTLPLTQEDFGDALGLTGVHVNRMFKRLRQDALVETWPGGLRVLDPDALRRAANFDPGYLRGWW